MGIDQKLNLEIVKQRLKEISPNIEITSKEYINAMEKLECFCLIPDCGYVWHSKWNHLSAGHRCPACANLVVHDGNRLSIIRPDLIKYFENPEDASMYSIKSNKKVVLKCPHCKCMKAVRICDLTKSGFPCPKCGDGVSIPNKLIYLLLQSLNINFEKEKTFSWSQRKKYDFYILELNMIIEANGIQHYKETNRGRSLQEEQENDILKERLAKENGIKHYVSIDCRNSSIDYLSTAIKKSMSEYLDFSTINWDEEYKKCSKQLTHECWEMYKKNNSIKEIVSELRVSSTTVRNYLLTGDKLGVIEYRGIRDMYVPVSQYSLNGSFIKSYESTMEASRQMGIDRRLIEFACKKIGRTSFGFVWKYKDR